jgi:hypothetical protein
LLPTVLAHALMAGADMLDIVPVEVRIHLDALFPENLMVVASENSVI